MENNQFQQQKLYELLDCIKISKYKKDFFWNLPHVRLELIQQKFNKNLCAFWCRVKEHNCKKNGLQFGFHYSHRGKHHEGLYNVKACFGSEVKCHNKFHVSHNIVEVRSCDITYNCTKIKLCLKIFINALKMIIFFWCKWIF